MSAAQRAAAGSGRRVQQTEGGGDDSLKRQFSNYETLLKKAADSGHQEEAEALAKGYRNIGGDPSPFLLAAGLQTPEEKQQKAFDSQLTSALPLIFGEAQSTATKQPLIPSTVTQAPPINQPLTKQPPIKQDLSKVAQDDLLRRMAVKKFTGLDIGENHLGNQLWYKEFNQRREANPRAPVSELVNSLAGEFGFLPPGASNLKDLSTEDRSVLFQKEFQRYLSDPVVNSVVSQEYPQLVDKQSGQVDEKTLAGVVLTGMAKEGFEIPEAYLPFLNHFRGLDTPEKVIGQDEAQWLWRIKGIHPADASPDDLNSAFEAVQNEKIINTAKQAAKTERAVTEERYDLERSKPIKAEERAKYGIGAKYLTYADIGEAAKRLPTEADRTALKELISIKDEMLTMETTLFGQGGKLKPSSEGIFTGIQADLVRRKAAHVGMATDIATGTARGRAIELYNRNLAMFGRRLLAIAEKGGRYTNQDVAQAMNSAPQVGGLFSVPDSEALAGDAYERFIITINKQIEALVGNVLLPGQTNLSTDNNKETATHKQDPQGSWWSYTEANGWQKNEKAPQ